MFAQLSSNLELAHQRQQEQSPALEVMLQPLLMVLPQVSNQLRNPLELQLELAEGLHPYGFHVSIKIVCH